MKRVLINYPFSDSSNDELSRVAGRDKINMWVAILLKHYHENDSVRFLFPNEFHDQKIDLEIHINCSQAISGAKKRIGLFMETPLIAPANSADNCAYYDLVISSDQSLLDAGNVILANLPCWDQDARLYSMVDVSELSRRASFSMICSNKYFQKGILYRDLYFARRRVIQFFEDHAETQLNLYGNGWNIPRLLLMYPKLAKRYDSLKIGGGLKCYRGLCKEKSAVLFEDTFNICYENCDYPNYVTEKLFDALCAGVVPVYMGEQSGHSIPVETHIDAAAFSSVKDLHEYCTQVTDSEIRTIIASGKTFLNGDGAKFSHQSYAKTVMQCINDVLGS